MNPRHLPTVDVRGGRTFFGGVALDELAAKFDTPLYVYNFDLVAQRVRELQKGLGSKPHLICYAVKANSSQALLKYLGNLGVGADVVSGGELQLARKAGISADKIVFSGVAKTADEIALGVREGILSFNVESPGEIPKITAAAAAQSRKAKVSLRINPDIDAKTHPKIATGLHATKFGIETKQAIELSAALKSHPHVELSGVSCHIGSQLLDLTPLLEAAALVKDFVRTLRNQGHRIEHIDLGGGLGVAYHPNEVMQAPGVLKYGEQLSHAMQDEPARLLLEPGRALVAEAGLLLTRVIEVKTTGAKTFVMVDAGMNDLARPSLYDAYHHIIPAWQRGSTAQAHVDVVGPVCETGDFFAIDRLLGNPQEGDLLALTHVGAYGFSMTSHYNMRPKPAEVAITTSTPRVIRQREKLADLWSNELS